MRGALGGFLAACIILFQSLVIAPAAAAPSAEPHVARGQTPDWVVPRVFPAPGDALRQRARSGIAYLLTDWQTRIGSVGYESYYRVTLKVVDRSGLEVAGKIQEEFDPRFQNLTLNFVHIIRDGRTIDLTPQVDFRLVQRETELDSGILNGQLTMLANLRDVRVGDIVDYATTYSTHDSLWRGHFFSSFTARMSEPLSLRSIRIDAPTALPLSYKALNSDFSFKEKIEAGRRIWEWTAIDPRSQDEEKNVPDWFPEYGRINISSMESWGEVARWAVPLYAGDETLTPEFEARLAEIGRQWPKAADRLTEVVRYLQDNIRYVGEEMGEGSYVPRRPRVVLEQGYGDCKDKSLLLAIALRRLGIDAWPALASTDIGMGLLGRLPAPIAFNHVIVRAELEGTVLWIDPTSTHQGGRGTAIVPADYGYGLPIRPGQATLERMVGYDKRAGRMLVTEAYAIDEKANPAARLKVTTVYTDGIADDMRSSLSTKPLSDFSKGNLEFYRKRYPGLVESEDLAISDDRDANRILMVENYRLGLAEFQKAALSDKLVTQAYAVGDLLPERQTGPRQNPLYVQGNLDREHVIELTAKGRALHALPDVNEEREGVAFRRTAARDGETLRIVYSLKSGTEEVVPADRAAAIYALSDRIGDEKGIEFYLNKSAKDANSPYAGIAALIAPYRDEIGKAGALMEKNDQPSLIEALTVLNGVSGKTIRPSELAGFIDGMKGIVLTRLNRYQPARAALESSIAQYHGNAEIIYLLAVLQIDQREPIAAVATLEFAAEHQPAMVRNIAIDVLQPLWQQLHYVEKPEAEAARKRLAVLLARSGWQQSPASEEGEQVIAQAIEALVEGGELAEAGKLLDRSTAAETVLRLAINDSYRPLWPQLEPFVRDRFRQRIADEIAVAAAAAAKTPDDFATMRRYLHVLRLAGQAPKAVEAGRRLAAQPERIEATGDGAFWFVNEYAYALSEAGRHDEALAELDKLMALGLDAYPALIGQAINRALKLNSMDRPQRALEAFKALDVAGGPRASPYGMMLIRAGQICALSSLGRGSEAGPLIAKVDADSAANHFAAILAYSCLADRDKMEALMLKRLDDPKARAQGLIGFTRFLKYAPSSAFDKRITSIMTEVRARPAVVAKLRTVGRIVEFDGSDIY